MVKTKFLHLTLTLFLLKKELANVRSVKDIVAPNRDFLFEILRKDKGELKQE